MCTPSIHNMTGNDVSDISNLVRAFCDHAKGDSRIPTDRIQKILQPLVGLGMLSTNGYTDFVDSVRASLDFEHFVDIVWNMKMPSVLVEADREVIRKVLLGHEINEVRVHNCQQEGVLQILINKYIIIC